MITTEYLIQPSYLKQYYAGYISNNVNDDLISNCILQAQEINLQNILGYNLYNKIIDGVTNANLAGDYLALYNRWILDELAYWTIWYLIPVSYFQITNGSISTMNYQNGQSVSYNDMIKFQQYFESLAKEKDKRILEEISNNYGKYPEYLIYSGFNRVAPDNQPYVSDFFVEGSGLGTIRRWERPNYPGTDLV